MDGDPAKRPSRHREGLEWLPTWYARWIDRVVRPDRFERDDAEILRLRLFAGALILMVGTTCLAAALLSFRSPIAGVLSGMAGAGVLLL